MLDDTLKQQIQDSYSRLLASRGYKPRDCQKRMIAEIARTLGGIAPGDDQPQHPRICVIEAGTGTGKTLAYALAALPIARAAGLPLVIATATVALQEQILYTDLPDIRRHAGLDFSFAIAKGRRRYLCLSRLDAVLQAGANPSLSLALYDDERDLVPDEASRRVYAAMLGELGEGRWDGDRDAWRDHLEDAAWNRVSTDHVRCAARQCSNYRNCSFFRARERVSGVDCIVTNHDLVLADLVRGGGAVLPDPAQAFFVFDEGHHLPDKAIQHFALSASLLATRNLLLQLPGSMRQLAEASGAAAPLAVPQALLGTLCEHLLDALATLESGLQPWLVDGGDLQRDSHQGTSRFRFRGGRVDGRIGTAMQASCGDFSALAGQLETLARRLEGLLPDLDGPERDELEPWLGPLRGLADRVRACEALWRDYAEGDAPGAPPRARWISRREGVEDFVFHSSPVAVDGLLADHLWNRVHGAVVTSATLAVGDDFEHFRQRSGIGENERFLRLPSPFHFARQGVLQIPRMTADPADAEAHTQMLGEMLPALLEGTPGSLVLFASWRQLERVLDLLPAEWRPRILAQGDLSKQELVKTHRERVERGEQSVIFGLASFAEGIDLPGRQCEHVVIAKIPFAVPDDPVEATLGEWIELRGGNAFRDLSLPAAILRLVQAGGRLLRTETDRGVVTLLDQRVLKRAYGRRILAAMPPFRVVSGEVPRARFD